MAGDSLTTASSLQCPHGAKVQISSTNKKAKAGAEMVTTADSFTISGCTWQIPTPVPVPSPCTTVMWIVPDFHVKVGGAAALDSASVGLCLAATGLPQGPVQVASTQSKVKAR
jgi:hypothetical protein